MLLKGIVILSSFSAVFCLTTFGRNYPYPSLIDRRYYSEEYDIPVDQTNKKQYIAFKDKSSWYNAKEACKTIGMILASPTTSFEIVQLKDYLYDNDLEPEDKFSGYWIGGSRISQEAPFLWESNGQEVTVGWLPKEPNGFDGENCVELVKSSSGSGWNNFYCSAIRGYICESSNRFYENPEKTKAWAESFVSKVHNMHEEMERKLFNQLFSEDKIKASEVISSVDTIKEKSVTDANEHLNNILNQDVESTTFPNLVIPTRIYKKNSFSISNDEIKTTDQSVPLTSTDSPTVSNDDIESTDTSVLISSPVINENSNIDLYDNINDDFQVLSTVSAESREKDTWSAYYLSLSEEYV